MNNQYSFTDSVHCWCFGRKINTFARINTFKFSVIYKDVFLNAYNTIKNGLGTLKN